jgi:protein SCO1/2
MYTVALSLLLAAGLAGCGAAACAHEGPQSRNPERSAESLHVGVQPLYRVPDVQVIDTRGRAVRLPGPLDAETPLLVNFIYTTCSTICSTQTATLAELQRRLHERGAPARFVSFTIDPDNDTPQRLAAFARQFSIERDWDFYSGDFAALLRLQQAFDVYRGSKAGHPPVVLMRRSRDAPWVRVEGFASPADLLAVFQRLPSAR